MRNWSGNTDRLGKRMMPKWASSVARCIYQEEKNNHNQKQYSSFWIDWKTINLSCCRSSASSSSSSSLSSGFPLLLTICCCFQEEVSIRRRTVLLVFFCQVVWSAVVWWWWSAVAILLQTRHVRPSVCQVGGYWLPPIDDFLLSLSSSSSSSSASQLATDVQQ